MPGENHLIHDAGRRASSARLSEGALRNISSKRGEKRLNNNNNNITSNNNDMVQKEESRRWR